MSITLSSSAFSDGETIPDRYGYTQENINPPLEIDGVPPETESLALIMDDPDAMEPAGKIWDHWIAWNIEPSVGGIPEDWPATGADEGTNDYGENGYGGPNPPDREHIYHFKLYALDTELNLASSANKEALEEAMEGHILDEAELTGTFDPSQT